MEFKFSSAITGYGTDRFFLYRSAPPVVHNLLSLLSPWPGDKQSTSVISYETPKSIGSAIYEILFYFSGVEDYEPEERYYEESRNA